MRLAVFTNQFPARVNTFFARDIAPLLSAGFEVELFPFYPVDPALWRYVPYVLSESTFPRNKIHYVNFAEAVRHIHYLPIRKYGQFLYDTLEIGFSAARAGFEPFVKSAYVALKALAWAQQSRIQYDHILAYWGNYAATSAYIFRRLTDHKVPLSIFLHAGTDLYANSVFLRQKLLAADKIITCSDFNRRFIQEHFSEIYRLIADKIYVHYHGVDLAEFGFQPNSRPAGTILAIGGLDESKGFNYLLRAAQQLSAHGIDYKIELVGDGKERASLKALAGDLQISDKVTFRGWVSPEEVPLLMRQSTVLVHPSSRLGDGVPNVIKEAMALGTPVIASAVAGIPELLGNGSYGMLVPPKDVEALANAIQVVFASEKLRLSYAYGGRRHVAENFDLWRNGRRLAEYLTAVPYDRQQTEC